MKTFVFLLFSLSLATFAWLVWRLLSEMVNMLAMCAEETMLTSLTKKWLMDMFQTLRGPKSLKLGWLMEITK